MKGLPLVSSNFPEGIFTLEKRMRPNDCTEGTGGSLSNGINIYEHLQFSRILPDFWRWMKGGPFCPSELQQNNPVKIKP